jgi:uncharacterized protein YciI
MLFALTAYDKPGSLDLRRATRDEHLDYWKTFGAGVSYGGPLLGPSGDPVGSVLIFTADDQNAAEAIAAADPYVKAGLFATTAIHPFREVFRAGTFLG